MWWGGIVWWVVDKDKDKDKQAKDDKKEETDKRQAIHKASNKEHTNPKIQRMLSSNWARPSFASFCETERPSLKFAQRISF